MDVDEGGARLVGRVRRFDLLLRGSGHGRIVLLARQRPGDGGGDNDRRHDGVIPFAVVHVSCSWKPLTAGLVLSSLRSVSSGVSSSGNSVFIGPASFSARYCAPS